MKNINNLELINYKLEVDILKLEKEINSLVDTRKILKRNKMDFSTIQGLIEQLTSTKNKYENNLYAQNALFNDDMVNVVLTKYLDKKLNKEEQLNLLKEFKSMYNRTYPNLQKNNKKGLSSWIGILDLDNFYTEEDDVYLELSINYTKNDSNGWCDATISLINAALDEPIKDANIIDGKIKSWRY